MTPATRRLDRLEEGVGELLEEHGDGADLERYEEYADDPVGFIREVLEEEPWDRQEAIAEAVRDRPQVTVRSCHAAGKDWLAARLALWWVYARRGLVVLTGPTAAQVEEILMRGEIREAFRGSGLPGDLHVRALRPGGTGGIIAKTATGTGRLTGFHDARVLFVLTEAQDPDAEPAWDAAFPVTTGAEDRILTLGNPTARSGRFHRAHQPSSDWHTVKIAAEDVPNVRQGETVVPGLLTEEGVERFASEYGRESPVYRSRVEAEFPETSTDSLIELEWLEDAVRRHEEGESPSDFYVLGVDPARHGPDETVVCVRRGDYVVGFRGWRGKDTQASARRVCRLVRRLHDGGESPVKAVCVDEIGLGAGVVDRVEEDLDTTWTVARAGRLRRVREKDTAVRGFNSSRTAPDDERFANTRAQAFWRVRERLEEGELALPDDGRLLEELKALRVEFTAQGKSKIASKEDIKSRLGRSPDRADALAVSMRPELREEEAREIAFFTV